MVRRLSLTAAGYDLQWLDSVRGEGYALRATLRDAGARLPLDVDARRAPTKHPLRVPAPSWIALGPVACAVALLVASALRGLRPVAAVAPIGPSPVRIGIAAPAGSVSLERALRDAESVVAHSADLSLAQLAITRGAAVLGRDSLPGAPRRAHFDYSRFSRRSRTGRRPTTPSARRDGHGSVEAKIHPPLLDV